MKRISYFSYKGGSGRSSLAYNTIPQMAELLHATPDEPVIVMDLDIDSAGLTFLLECDDLYDNGYYVQDVIDGNIPGLIRTPSDTPIKTHPFFSHLRPVGTAFGLKGEGANESILFLPVKIGVNLNSDNNYDRADNQLINVTKLCKTYNCKALIFDTPTGDQLTASWALDVSTDILIVMKITFQFRRGTISFLKRKDNEFCDKNYIIVPNCVPQDEIYIDNVLYNYQAIKEEIYTNVLNIMQNNRVNLKMLEDNCFGIPEVKRFKVQEGILYKLSRLTEDENLAYNMYKRISAITVGS